MSGRFPVPQDAIDFLSSKQIVQTEDWDDLKWGEHTYAFTVAHSINAAILNDIYRLMQEAMQQGTTFRDFRKQMIPLMEKNGWYGRADEEDGGKSRDKGKKTGSKGTYTNWRLKMIYNTNMLTSYSAGRTRQMLRTAHLRPWWMYLSLVVGKNRRKAHKELHRHVFRYDDPFWSTYDPPNGWNCKCGKKSLSTDELHALGIEVSTLEDVPDTFAGQVPAEWQYSPGREMYAPDFNQYNYLQQYQVDGKPVLEQIKKNYRDGLTTYEMRPGEWSVWCDSVMQENYTPAGYQVLGGVMPEEIYSTIDLDPKMMISDLSLKKNSQRLPLTEIKDLKQGFTEPDLIYRQDDQYYFLTQKTGTDYLCSVFGKKHETTSLQLAEYRISALNEFKDAKLLYRRNQ